MNDRNIFALYSQDEADENRPSLSMAQKEEMMWLAFPHTAVEVSDFNAAFDIADGWLRHRYRVDTSWNVAFIADLLFFHTKIWWRPNLASHSGTNPKLAYRDKLNDPRWQKKRLRALERDDFTCQRCGEKNKPLHVHHKRYRGEPWDVPDAWLETLCEDCHMVARYSPNPF